MKVELSRKFLIRASIAIAAVILIAFIIWKWRARSGYRIPENSSTTNVTYSPTAATVTTPGAVGTGTITITIGDKAASNPFSTGKPVTITGAPADKTWFNIVNLAPSSVSSTIGAGWTATFAVQTAATAGSLTADECKAMLVAFDIAKTYIINTITGTGTTVSVTFSAPHGLTTGQTITVSGGTAPAAGTYAVSDALITVTGASTITYPGTGTTGTITVKPTVTISTSAEYNTLNTKIRDCYNAFTKAQIAGDATATSQRDECLKQYTLQYIKGKCAIIGTAETSSTAYTTQTTEINAIRKAYIQYINPVAGDLTGLNLSSYNINKTALGLPGTATDLQVIAKVATKARDADIAAAGRKYISAMCPDFYTISLPDGTGEITRDYSGIGFNSSNVSWARIFLWARYAYAFVYTPGSSIAAGSGEFASVYGGSTSGSTITTETKTAIVAGSAANFTSLAATVFTSTSTTDYIAGVTTQQTFGDVARFFGPGATSTGTGYSTLPNFNSATSPVTLGYP
jgi:hypothetical protein